MIRSLPLSVALLLGSLALSPTRAQVASYTFSSSVDTWVPIAGGGLGLGMPGLPSWFAFDDNSFVTEGGQNDLLSVAVTGNGWPIGFPFHFNGHVFDRVGLSMEGWLSFGHSSDGLNAVYTPYGSTAYTPLTSALPAQMAPGKRNRVAAFSMDLAAQGSGGTWPVQIRTSGFAPNRFFMAEWNVLRSGGSSLLSFQIRLNEGGGDPAAQTVQVIYGGMTQTVALQGQVGLAGDLPSDFNNRSVASAPFDWQQSLPGAVNSATCRPPSTATYLPPGLTFTWTPPACMVYGIAVEGFSIAAGNIDATLSWSPVNGATSYDYVITAGSASDPALLSGSGVAGTSVALAGLPTDQDLFAYVRANCGAPASGWGAAYPFTTQDLFEVVCGEAPLHFEHCYADLEESTWYYHGSGSDPLRLTINAGTVSNGDVLSVFDGPTDQAPLLFSSTTGLIAGQVINSSGPYITMKLVADHLGSCMNHEFIEAMAWEVGCVDCDPVLANYSVVDDCENQQFFVQVDVFTVGSSTGTTITNDAGAPVVPVPGPGTYTAGPFALGTSVVVTAAHGQNAYCSSMSSAMTNGNCPIVGCGPDAYEHCYTNNDQGEWAYTSGASDRIGVRFRHGTVAAGDQLRVFDGTDIFSATLLQTFMNTDLSGRMVASPVGGDLLMLQAATDGSTSCADGAAQAWEYIVACYDGCAQPAAIYTVVDDCANGAFSIVVDVTDLGSGGSVVVSNDGGVPAFTATATGAHTVGPFPSTALVTVDVEGVSVLCGTNSPRMGSGCGMGILERAEPHLVIYPNPGNGTFRITKPQGFGGRGELEVLDLSGRRVAGMDIQQTNGHEVLVELDGLPVGSYVLMLRDDQRVHTGRLVVTR